MAKFSQKSLTILTNNVADDMVAVSHLALQYATKIGKDFGINEGFRTAEYQNKLFKAGKSEKDGYINKSEHQNSPSTAIDFYPYDKKFGALFGSSEQVSSICRTFGCSSDRAYTWIKTQYELIWMCFQLAAAELKMELTWGNDWDNDGYTLNTKFQDLGHIQKRKV